MTRKQHRLSILTWSHQHSLKFGSWCSRVYSTTSNMTLMTMQSHQSRRINVCKHSCCLSTPNFVWFHLQHLKHWVMRSQSRKDRVVRPWATQQTSEQNRLCDRETWGWHVSPKGIVSSDTENKGTSWEDICIRTTEREQWKQWTVNRQVTGWSDVSNYHKNKQP